MRSFGPEKRRRVTQNYTLRPQTIESLSFILNLNFSFHHHFHLKYYPLNFIVILALVLLFVIISDTFRVMLLF
jgi:hypothetical protein